MPVFGNPDVKGDLFVEYNVILPVEISPEMRRSKLLSHANYISSTVLVSLRLLIMLGLYRTH